MRICTGFTTGINMVSDDNYNMEWNMSEASEALSKLNNAVYGNGKPGLLTRMELHEKEVGQLKPIVMVHEERLDELDIFKMQFGGLVKAVVKEAMEERARSKEGIIRALGPYFTAIVGLASAIVVILLGG